MAQPNPQPVANSNNTIWIYLSYILGWLFGLIGLAVVKDDIEVRYHCAQALVFSVVAWLAVFIIGLIPILGWVVSPLLSIAVFVYSILIALKAAKGEHVKIPFCGDFAEKNLMNLFK